MIQILKIYYVNIKNILHKHYTERPTEQNNDNQQPPKKKRKTNDE